MVPDHWLNDAMVSIDRCGLQQSLPSLPPGKLPHHVLPWSSHLEQQEGDFFQLSPQKEADFDGKEAEMNPHNNFVFGPETLCWSDF